ncbi:hypothetical protein PsorP6_012644 [Peronosclerospora sorghi]|uniref:Uncharacterized protein n=1 Tax=Peronosclerospora sorghi TaxID=230839 RepID=A0ACC0WGJ8_9STRA|nr:hypothetical protein PsorP6_012644 [Peronosclerospora sorghi]
MMIEYASNMEGYKVLHLEANTVKVSRMVAVDEREDVNNDDVEEGPLDDDVEMSSPSDSNYVSGLERYMNFSQRQHSLLEIQQGPRHQEFVYNECDVMGLRPPMTRGSNLEFQRVLLIMCPVGDMDLCNERVLVIYCRLNNQPYSS